MKEPSPEVSAGDGGPAEDLVRKRGSKSISDPDSGVGGGAGGIACISFAISSSYSGGVSLDSRDIVKDVVRDLRG